MLAHILVWIIGFIIGFIGFLWLLRPLIIHHHFKSSQGLFIHIITCIITLAILVGFLVLIYFKFNRVFVTSIISYVISLVAVINSCNKEIKG